MKKVVLIMVLLVINSFLLSNKIIDARVDNIDLNLNNNELSVIFIPIPNNDSILLSVNNKNILYLVNYNNIKKIEKYLDVFKLKIDYIISSDNYNIESNLYSVLSDKMVYNGVIFKKKEYLQIQYLNHKICIDAPPDTDCDYIYFVNNKKLMANDNTKVLFYNNTNINNLNNVYSKWIDIYKLDNKLYTILKLSNKYEVIEIEK